MIISDDYAKFAFRYNVICSKSLVEISKLKLAMSWTLTFSPIKMMGSLWLVNESYTGINEVNLMVADTFIIGNNVYTENLEEMQKLSNYKEYFKENPHSLGFPASHPIQELPWKGNEEE